MKTPPLLSVVIPVYRGERVLPSTIAAVLDHARMRQWSIEIIVAASGTGDRTHEVAHEAARAHDNIVVLDTTSRFGKGGAVQAGMAAARGQACCFIDADNGVAFEQVDAALAALDRYDVVIGSRYVAGGDPGSRTLGRRLVSRGGNLLMHLLLGLPYADTRAPLKVFRHDVAKSLFAASRLRGFGFDSEILYIARRRGLRVQELPVSWIPTDETTVNVRVEVIRSI